MVFAGGVGDWRKLANINDPLPQAMKIVVGANSGWLHMLVWHRPVRPDRVVPRHHHGLLAPDLRARARRLPAALARAHAPAAAARRTSRSSPAAWSASPRSIRDQFVTIAGQTLTANIVTMSVLGAIVMYLLSLVSLMRLRRLEPALPRPFRTPLYPLFPLVALGIALVSLGAISWYNPAIAAIFVAAGTLGGLGTWVGARRGALGGSDPMLRPPAA